MTTTHQLMAAAFCLCGLWFLFHFDPVNSIICKKCNNTDANCNSGEVADAECEPSMPYCITSKIFRSDGRITATRSCSKASFVTCIKASQLAQVCAWTCKTDRCNNKDNDLA
ncbi:uncharacterized protein LOC112568265 [Pomacea canaliculata]|uniref:uncharacterized protein LOC112568265 n=1 Tax=Pomacea canaliculata TaxID=400727 RepID=UPI000D732CFC|nr:uncharacterized protein LOC112568265 [Pomacea canaliculata]